MSDQTTEDPKAIRDAVRERYAAAARAVGGDVPEAASCCGSDTDASCCGSEAAVITAEQTEHFGSELYAAGERETLPAAAVLASLGCGNPTAVAELHVGETVLDLGSGGGIDVLLSARRVGPTGKAYGLDMTDEMLELARRNQSEAGVENVEFLKGTIEEIPLPDASVDVVISNCVINLSGDKPGCSPRPRACSGRVVASPSATSSPDPEMDEATRKDIAQWTGCIAGALTEHEFREGLAASGLESIEVSETHRVHEHAGSAIIRARKPSD